MEVFNVQSSLVHLQLGLYWRHLSSIFMLLLALQSLSPDLSGFEMGKRWVESFQATNPITSQAWCLRFVRCSCDVCEPLISRQHRVNSLSHGVQWDASRAIWMSFSLSSHLRPHRLVKRSLRPYVLSDLREASITNLP